MEWGRQREVVHTGEKNTDVGDVNVYMEGIDMNHSREKGIELAM